MIKSNLLIVLILSSVTYVSLYGSPKKVVFGFYPSWNGTSGYNYVPWDAITYIADFSLEVNSDGSVTDNTTSGLVSTATFHGVTPVLVATCFDATTIHSILTTSSDTAITNIVGFATTYGYKGICIDFEGVSLTDRDYLTNFMQALKNRFLQQVPTGTVWICVPAVISNAFDVTNLGNICDGLFIMGYDYHWRGSSRAGPVSPFSSTPFDSYYVRKTIDSYLTYTTANKLILGLPYYGYKWPTVDDVYQSTTTGSGVAILYKNIVPLVGTYGSLWDNYSQTPWLAYTITTSSEVYYDNVDALRIKYLYSLEKSLKGVGMWALAYDGSYTELRELLRESFCGPSTPTVLATRNNNTKGVEILWKPNPENDISSYEIYCSTLMFSNFQLIKEVSANSTYYYFSKEELPFDDRPLYFYIKAKNSSGYTSLPSDVFAVLPSYRDTSRRVLIVNDSSRFYNNNYAVLYADSLFNANTGPYSITFRYVFDTVTSFAVKEDIVKLSSYAGVIWYCANDSSSQGPIDAQEQVKLQQFLDNNGKLFITGQDIGYGLDYKLNGVSFYNNYLKADYVADNAAVYRVNGVTGSCFSGRYFLLGNPLSNASGYGNALLTATYPEVITTYGGSSACLTYEGTSNIAAVEYQNKLVYLGFNFESLSETPVYGRNRVMGLVMKYLNIPAISTTPPTAITTLTAIPGPQEGEVTLEWYCSETLFNALYAIRYTSCGVITNWDNIPQPFYELLIPTDTSAGYYSFVISSLQKDTTWYFVLKLRNEDDLWSNMSNTTQTVSGFWKIIISKSVSSSSVLPGDTIEYIVEMKNLGNITAYNVSFKDKLPENTEFEPNSYGSGYGIKINDVPKTNIADGDEAEFITGDKIINVNFSQIVPSSVYIIKFKLRIL